VHELAARFTSALGTAGVEHLRFAQRFDIVSGEEETLPAIEEAARFVFRRSLAEVLDPAPRTESRLERVVASTLRSGRNWTMPTGVLKVRTAW
jgi:hypothetical protein